MAAFRSFCVLAFAATAACAAAPSPEANGYDVQLYFDGVPLGSETLVGKPAIVTVRRLEQRTDLCTGGASCDPTSQTPITLISAACDAICTVTALPTTDGSVTLEATANRAGSTTLRVHVRSQVDGAEWDDGYPLSFRAPSRGLLPAPIAVSIDKLPSEK